MTLSRNQKIGIGIGAGILIGCVIYFGFIRKADEVAEAVSDPSMGGGTSGGQGGSPSGSQAKQPVYAHSTPEMTKKVVSARG